MMRKTRIALGFTLVMLLLVLFAGCASAAPVLNGRETMTFQVGLGTSYSEDFVFYSSTDGSSRFFLSGFTGTNDDLAWSITALDGGPEFNISAINVAPGQAFVKEAPNTNYSAGGPYNYTVSCVWNENTYSKNLQITLVDETIPSGCELRIARVDLSTQPCTIGPAQAVENYSVQLIAGETYVITPEFTGDFSPVFSEARTDSWVTNGMRPHGSGESCFMDEDGRSLVLSSLIGGAVDEGTYQNSITVGAVGTNVVCRVPLTVQIISPEELSMDAYFIQSRLQAGRQADLDWRVFSGTAPYQIQMEWVAQSGCLIKEESSTFTAASESGSVSFAVPSGADQLKAVMKVTDGNGRSTETERYLWDTGSVYTQKASVSFVNDADVAGTGDQIACSWEIAAAGHTISHVRYKWVAWQDHELVDLTSWTDAGNNLTGRAEYTAAESGVVYLHVIFDAEDGWYYPGGYSDPIQVMNPGEIPLSAAIQITPGMGTVGKPFTIPWSVSGEGSDPEIWIEWRFDASDGTRERGFWDVTGASGTQTFTPTKVGWLDVWIYATNNDTGAYIQKHASNYVQEASGITLSVSPENPKLGEPVTISWTIDRDDYTEAYLDVTLYSGNLYKQVELPAYDLVKNKTGSLTMTLNEGESFDVFVTIYVNDRPFQEAVYAIPLSGNVTPLDPVETRATYHVDEHGTITANYTVSGGTGHYDDLYAYWWKNTEDAGWIRCHKRMLQSASGTLTYTPSTPGTYMLVIDAADHQSGWTSFSFPASSANTITVSGVNQRPLGIDFFDGLPGVINLNGQNMIAWDITGVDGNDYIYADVHMETDDGIILVDDITTEITSYWVIPTEQIGPESRSVTISLTPHERNTTGDTVTRTIPIRRGAGGTLYLPRNLKIIEAEAFLNTDASVIDIPDSVISIGNNAFPGDATLIVGAGSYAYSWAADHGYENIVVR